MSTTEATLQDRAIESVEFYQQAKYRDAEAGFAECVATARTLLNTPLLLVESLNDLATAHFALSRYNDALETLNEAISLVPSADNSPQWQALHAILLNNQARIFSELERFDEVETNLLRAIELVAPLHPVYAAEFHANFVRVATNLPRWRNKIKHHADEFDRLHEIGEKLEVYTDDIAGWRRPGRNWDVVGSASPESIQARSINNHIKHRHEYESDAKSDYEEILKIDEESKQVSPHMVVHAHLSLAEIAAHATDFIVASKHCDEALRVSSSSYLRSHPSNYAALLKAASYSLLGGSFDKARKTLDSTKELVREHLGEFNPHYARCVVAEALLSPIFQTTSADKSEEQLVALRTCRELMQKFFPDTHSSVLDLNGFIINLCVTSNRFDEAERLLNETSKNSLKNTFDPTTKQRRCLHVLTDLRIKQGRPQDADTFLKMNESLLAQQQDVPAEEKVRELGVIGKLYMDAGLFADGERVYREIVAMTVPMKAKIRQTARQHLALCLMRVGKTIDAGDVLGNVGEVAPGAKKEASRRDELVTQSHLAWGLQTKRRFEQAKALANEVVAEAHLLMPECEEALVIALSVLMEQAKSDNQPEEMLRMIGMLSDFEASVRLRATMPVLYLEAAQAFAKQKSIKAEGLFERAVQTAEASHALAPHCLDACVLAYMNHCAASRMNDKALQLCERLIAIRAAANGPTSLEYAVAITAKARLMSDSDPNGAEPLTLEALNILESQNDPTTKLQLLVTVSVREGLLKKLLKFDEAEKMTKRSAELRAELDSHIAAIKASRELSQ